METVLAILYSLVGYWAVNRTIYAHYVMVGDIDSIILRKWMVGLIAGPVCIPWAVIKLVAANKGECPSCGRLRIFPAAGTIGAESEVHEYEALFQAADVFVVRQLRHLPHGRERRGGFHSGGQAVVGTLSAYPRPYGAAHRHSTAAGVHLPSQV